MVCKKLSSFILFHLILDFSMPAKKTGEKITLIADGVLKAVNAKKKGYQMVIGADYDVSDFGNDVTNDTIKVKSNKIVLMVGNHQMEPGKSVNISKQIEKLINKLWVKKPTATVYVCSLIPQPTQETLMEPILMAANSGISQMCKRLHKYRQNTVKYIPIHQVLLEKWRHPDNTGKMLKTTRIIQPHGKYYTMGTDHLNMAGIEIILQQVENVIKLAEGEHVEGALDQCDLGKKPNLIVQVDNSPDGSVDVVMGTGTPCGLGDSKSQTRKSATDGGDRRSSSKRKAEKTQERRSKVSKLVEKWERLSHTEQQVDSLDLELGGESIVPVDLGDSGPGSESGVMDS